VYGTIRLFDPDELASRGSGALFDVSRPSPAPVAQPSAAAAEPAPSGAGPEPTAAPAAVGLDPDQAAVVTAERGPLLVVAGPGAGKTRVLTQMIAHRIAALGVAPEGCLAVTFTRRAAAELRERLTALLGDDAGRVTVATFHGLGLIILRENFPAPLHVAHEPARRAVLREVLGEGFSRAQADQISATKRAVAGLPASASQPDTELLHRYDSALRERGLVDLDDLITMPVTRLTEDESLARSYRDRWTDVFVDEYQDVDELQYRLLRLICPPGGRPPVPPDGVPDGEANISGTPGRGSSVTVIGDPDQSIYGFRGGDVGYFLRFRSDYAGAREARLERSYRSAPSIVKSAMQLIRPGTLVPGRRLEAARADIQDGPVVLRRCPDERDEAELVAATIEKMLGGTSLNAFDRGEVDSRAQAEHQLSFSDFAVLYRTSSQAGAVAEALGRRGFPAQQRSHARLADMPGVPEILAALSGQLFPASAGALAGDTVGGQLRAAVDMALSVAGEEPGPAIRSAAEVLTPLAARCGDDLARFLDELAMGAEVDTWDPRADRITMLTLHASKGLEFPVVFIVGCDDGLLPLRPWSGAEVDYAEERRLLFVGMTRATTRLILTGADKRVIRGEARESLPSPFLSSVDRSLLDTGGPEAARQRKRRPADQQLTLL
jgi:superfamily I DNA/RNA helicase